MSSFISFRPPEFPPVRTLLPSVLNTDLIHITYIVIQKEVRRKDFHIARGSTIIHVRHYYKYVGTFNNDMNCNLQRAGV